MIKLANRIFLLSKAVFNICFNISFVNNWLDVQVAKCLLQTRNWPSLKNFFRVCENNLYQEKLFYNLSKILFKQTKNSKIVDFGFAQLIKIQIFQRS